ncbi:mCG1047177, partial [Mus musculus]
SLTSFSKLLHRKPQCDSSAVHSLFPICRPSADLCVLQTDVAMAVCLCVFSSLGTDGWSRADRLRVLLYFNMSCLLLSRDLKGSQLLSSCHITTSSSKLPGFSS